MNDRFIVGVHITGIDCDTPHMLIDPTNHVSLLFAEPATLTFYWGDAAGKRGFRPVTIDEIVEPYELDPFGVDFFLVNSDGSRVDASMLRPGEISSWLLSRCRELAGDAD